jgi:hypothetical protein
MTEPALPSGEPASAPSSETTSEQRIRIWLDLLGAGHKLVLAGLRREVGPDGDVREAYRRWYAEQMAEHDRVVTRMLERMKRRRNAT